MNIHEHQAKELLKKFGAPVPEGIVIYDLKEIKKKIKKLAEVNLVFKAQIHATSTLILLLFLSILP